MKLQCRIIIIDLPLRHFLSSSWLVRWWFCYFRGSCLFTVIEQNKNYMDLIWWRTKLRCGFRGAFGAIFRLEFEFYFSNLCVNTASNFCRCGLLGWNFDSEQRKIVPKAHMALHLTFCPLMNSVITVSSHSLTLVWIFLLRPQKKKKKKKELE